MVRASDSRLIVDTGTATEQEMVHWLEVLDLLTGLEDVVLGSTEAHGLLSLGLGAGQNDDVASHRGGQLNRQVA